MTDPDISVVIPVGRCDDLLALQLRALDGQDDPGRPWEIVLSCNTTDPTEREALDALATAHARTRVIDSSDMRSAAHARNRGASEAYGSILAFCDGDDIAEPGWLAAIVAPVDDRTVVGGHLDEDALCIDGQENWRPPATPGALPTFLGYPYLISASMAMPKRLFTDVGGFDTSLTRGEDIAFAFALSKAGAKLVYTSDAVMQYRHRAGLVPMLRQHYLYGRGMAQVLDRIGLPDGSTTALLRPNAQRVAQWNVAQFLRRGALGLGRVHGATIDRWRYRRSVGPERQQG